MNRLMQNKVVLITGGSSGIGKAAAFAFAAQGGREFLPEHAAGRYCHRVGLLDAADGAAAFRHPSLKLLS